MLIDPENPKENESLSSPENWRSSSGDEGLPGRDDRVSFADWLSNQPNPDPSADINPAVNHLSSQRVR